MRSSLNFVRNAADACVPSPLRPDLWAEPENCAPGTSYTVPSGYDREPDNVCVATTPALDLTQPLRRICVGGTTAPSPTGPVSGVQSNRVRAAAC